MTFRDFFSVPLLSSFPVVINHSYLTFLVSLSSQPFLAAVSMPRAVVHVQVDDVNEFSPVFREPLYKASLTEHKIYDSILQVSVSRVCLSSSQRHSGLKYHPFPLNCCGVSQSGVTPPNEHQR